MDGYEKLANAIIVQAVKDFRAAYKRLKHFPNDSAAKYQAKCITKFFHSKYCGILTQLDGPFLLRKIIEEMEGGGAR